MLEQISEEKTLELARKQRNLSVVLADESCSLITLHLPEPDELNSIRNLYFQKVSANEVCKDFRDTWRAGFEVERDRLLRKKENFGGSPTFLSHLATLSEFSGDLPGCVDHLRTGLAVDRSSYFRERLGRALIGLKDYSEAESVFRDADLQTDAAANLELAYIEALRGEFGRASELVQSTLDIDGTNWRALLFAGALELQRQNPDQAIRFFRSASEDRQSSSAAYLLTAAAYWRSDRTDKAIDVLRRAVAMNPIDENAVIFFADALMSKNRFEDASRALMEFTQYEQKSAAAWDRLARSCFETGLNQKALEYLKHQASVSEGPGVWNNMGLVFWRMGDQARSLKYLGKAIDASKQEGFSAFLPFYNTYIYLRNSGRLDEALQISELIPREKLPELARRRISSTILALRCEALADAGRIEQAEAEYDHLFTLPEMNKNLYHALLLSATYFYSLVCRNAEKALECSKWALKAAQEKSVPKKQLGPLLNNVVFVLLEFGKTDEAEKLLPLISPWVHKSPLATATLGLLHLRKGHFESGKALYEEALALTGPGLPRRRLRQKMQLEIGKFLSTHGSPQGAARHLKEAESASTGLKAVEREATQLLRSLQ